MIDIEALNERKRELKEELLKIEHFLEKANRRRTASLMGTFHIQQDGQRLFSVVPAPGTKQTTLVKYYQIIPGRNRRTFLVEDSWVGIPPDLPENVVQTSEKTFNNVLNLWRSRAATVANAFESADAELIDAEMDCVQYARLSLGCNKVDDDKPKGDG